MIQKYVLAAKLLLSWLSEYEEVRFIYGNVANTPTAIKLSMEHRSLDRTRSNTLVCLLETIDFNPTPTRTGDKREVAMSVRRASLRLSGDVVHYRHLLDAARESPTQWESEDGNLPSHQRRHRPLVRAKRWRIPRWVINLAVGCHYFPPGLQLPPQPLRGLLPISMLGEQRHDGCEQFSYDCYPTASRLRFEPRPESSTLTTRLPSHPLLGIGKGKGNLYSIAERRVPELIPVLDSQPAGNVSHKPGGRLPLLSARPAVTLATLKKAAINFAAW